VGVLKITSSGKKNIYKKKGQNTKIKKKKGEKEGMNEGLKELEEEMGIRSNTKRNSFQNSDGSYGISHVTLLMRIESKKKIFFESRS
jgi:hypothetical protein